MAMRHSSGCETLIRISFFMLCFLVRQDRQAGIRSGWPAVSLPRRGGPSGIDLHGGAPEADALVFEIGQVQGGQHVARAGSWLRVQPGGALPSASPAERQRLEVGAEVDDRVAARRCHGQEAAAHRRRDPLFQADAARRRQGRLVGGAAGPGLAAAGGQDFHRPERPVPAGLAATAAASSPPAGAFRSIRTSMTSSSPSIPTAKARGNVSRGLGWKPWLIARSSPARRKSRSRHRIRSRCPIRRRSPCLLNRMRTRGRTIGSNCYLPPPGRGGRQPFPSSAAKAPRKAPGLARGRERQINYIGSLSSYPGNALVQFFPEVVLDVAGVFHGLDAGRDRLALREGDVAADVFDFREWRWA